MLALRLVATCVLAAMVASLGLMGLRVMNEIKKRNVTEKAASSILEAVRACLAAPSKQVLEVELFEPLLLVENKIMVGKSVYGEFEGRFCQEVRLSPGKYFLRIRLVDNGIKVEI